MKFSLSDSIGKKIFVLITIPVIACLIITVIGLISLKVVDRALILTRAERDHTINFYQAALNFEEYARNGDVKFYQQFNHHMEIAERMSGIFGSTIEDLKIKSKEKIAGDMAHWFPSVDYDQARDLVTIVDFLSSHSLVVSLVEIAKNANSLAVQYLALAEKYTKIESINEKQALLADIDKM